MACARLTAALVAALAVAAPAGSALAARTGPQSLRAFTLRADEPVGHTFSRTPSFAWSPVPGALSYEFELSTSKRFSESGTVWSTSGLKTPMAAVPISLPWITGSPYSLYAHVRAVTRKGATAWSEPFGFNIRAWPSVPTPVTPAVAGLLRWTAVPGANAYDVWLRDIPQRFTVRTNMADERAFYTFHQDPAFSGVVHWRVRAVRWLYGQTDNSLPATSYGAWSPIYSSYNPPFATGPLTPLSTISNVVSDATHTRVHEIMPAFQYSGNTSIWNAQYELYRVIVFTDEDCLNPVFRGAITGAPVYVPRAAGPLSLPTAVTGITGARTAFLSNGIEPDSYTYDYMPVRSNESDVAPVPPSGGATGLPPAQVLAGAKVDLWDSDWPGGEYFWTVMPVDAEAAQTLTTTLANAAVAGDTTITVADGTGIIAGDALRVGSPLPENAVVQSVLGNVITLVSGLSRFHSGGEDVVRPGGGVTYREAELTQDTCAAGRRLTFAKTSEPALTGQGTPFVSGLSPQGKLVSARSSKPRFYGQPLIAWQPLVNADQYEVQWSAKPYPWKTAGTQFTWGTSVSLPLSPGTWFYRVRGLDYQMTGSKPQMSWSDPVRVIVTKPRFRVVH
ncbi:MAG: hypothetical protein M3R39_04625 [Actinomycetota bacterium]|nr:hypothetical protein [Actinomycetota bacterium]